MLSAARSPGALTAVALVARSTAIPANDVKAHGDHSIIFQSGGDQIRTGTQPFSFIASPEQVSLLTMHRYALLDHPPAAE